MSNHGSQSEPTSSRRLGKGLGALLGTSSKPVQVEPVVAQPSSSKGEIRSLGENGLLMIDLGKIETNKFQPRRKVSESSIAALADSVRRSGVMQPVVVRRTEAGAYELVAGERRWRAAQLAGLTTIPAVVRELSDADSAEWAVVENVQREDLNAMDRAWALRNLHDRFGRSHQEIAESVGMDRSSVVNLIRLTELEAEVASLVAEGQLSAGHGRALLGIDAGPRRVELAKRCASLGWSVRQCEQAVRATANAGNAVVAPAAESSRVAVLSDLERRLGQFLGTKVKISTSRKGERGTILIEYYGLDHFDGLLNRIGFQSR